MDWFVCVHCRDTVCVLEQCWRDCRWLSLWRGIAVYNTTRRQLGRVSASCQPVSRSCLPAASPTLQIRRFALCAGVFDSLDDFCSLYAFIHFSLLCTNTFSRWTGAGWLPLNPDRWVWWLVSFLPLTGKISIQWLLPLVFITLHLENDHWHGAVVCFIS